MAVRNTLIGGKDFRPTWVRVADLNDTFDLFYLWGTYEG